MSDRRTCALVNCENRTRDNRCQRSDVRFHELPKDEHQAKIWVEWINNYNHFDLRTTNKGKCYLCSDHFSDNFKGKRKLKAGAIPSLFKENQLLDQVSSSATNSPKQAGSINTPVASSDTSSIDNTTATQSNSNKNLACIAKDNSCNTQDDCIKDLFMNDMYKHHLQKAGNSVSDRTDNDKDYNLSMKDHDLSWENMSRARQVYVQPTPCLVVDLEDNLDKSDVLFDPGLPFIDSNEDLDVSTQEIFYVPWKSEIGHMPEHFSCETPSIQDAAITSCVVVDTGLELNCRDPKNSHHLFIKEKEHQSEALAPFDETMFPLYLDTLDAHTHHPGQSSDDISCTNNLLLSSPVQRGKELKSQKNSPSKKSNRQCAVCKCRGKLLHSFPAIVVAGVVNDDNLKRCGLWIKASGCNDFLEKESSKLHSNYAICTDHFETNQYYNSRRRKLLPNAVPTIFQNQPLTEQQMSKYPVWGPARYITENETARSRLLQEEEVFNDQNNNEARGPADQDTPGKLDGLQTNFENAMKSLEWRRCPKCKEIFVAPKKSKKTCCHTKPICRTLSEDNDMDPGEIPEELKDLTPLEEQLIARIHPLISVYKLKKTGRQFAYSGNVINFSQDVKSFAKMLPHNINDLTSMITVRSKKEDVNYKDFRVRAGVVRRALMWLKEHNPFYFDVEISDCNLNLIPDDGNLYDMVQSIDIDEDSPTETQGRSGTSPEETTNGTSGDKDDQHDSITETSVPYISVRKEQDHVNAVLEWPAMAKDAIDEFNTIGYVVQAFPCLFPYGKCDLRSPREHKVSETVYFQHLMRFHDKRFAQHARFRFFCFNSLMRWTALRDGKIFIERHPEFKNLTVAQLKQKLQEDPALVKKIMFQGNNLRGTKSYWYARGKELQAMMEQLGPPTLFVTLSAADMHWPELYNILAPGEDIATMSEFRRSQLVQQNPLVVDEFFLTRCESFFDEVLKKKYKIKDHWFRIEYQHRGSPHLHGVLWLDGAPDISNLAAADDEEKDSIINYFDELVSTMNPNINEPPAEVHPCRLRLSEVLNMEQDLAHLLNKVQRHTKCTQGYCLRKDKTNNQHKCRFGFPEPLCEKTHLDFTDKDNVKLLTKRDDPRLNKYNQYIIQTWRGNIDVSPVLSIRALVNYLAKYISKSETKSQQLADLVKSVIENVDKDKPAKHALQKIFIKTCAERDFSAQEVCHILMGLKLVSSGGRKFVSINFNEKKQWLQIMDNPSRKQPKSFPVKYKEREEDHDKCMWELAKQYNISKAHKHNIIQVFPKTSLKPNSEDNDHFYRQQCLLYIPWHGSEECLKNADDNWKEVYDRNIELIKKNQATTQLLAVPGASEDTVDDDEMEVENPLEDWMHISRMRDNRVLQSTSIGLREFDLSKDWHAALSQYEELGGLPYLESFLQNSKDAFIHTEPAVQENEKAIQWSPEQQQVIDLVKHQIHAIKTGCIDNIPPKKVMIQGKAGTGKSLVIHEITRMIIKEFGPDAVLLLGPTGVSAVNIYGATIHSGLSINCFEKVLEPLSGPRLHAFQHRLQNTKFLILDEMSMVGCRMLHFVDQRLRQATGKDEYFGGVNAFLLGDIMQLAPIGDPAAYSSTQNSMETLQGKLLYDSMDCFITLKKIHRQQDKDFLEVLEHISQGCVTKEDYKLLQTRFTTTVSSSERATFKDSLHLYAHLNNVKEFNEDRLASLSCGSRNFVPAVRVPAKNNCREAQAGTTDMAQNLENHLYLAEGASIMLRSNLWTERGLVNGAMGKVVDILYHPDATPSYDQPAVLICQFDKYKGPFLDEQKKTVPIIPKTIQWTTDDGTACSRTQFPITLAYATTIHKSQGITLDKVFVDLGKSEKPGLSYVGLSRVKTLEGLLLQPFPFSRLANINKSNAIGERRKWQENLEKKSSRTI